MILIININNEGGVLSPFLFSFVLDLYKIYFLERINAVYPEWIPAVVFYQEVLDFEYLETVRILREYLATI